eukprot:CAMPEP_0179158910 /NCGR_PEP_ID=MMETSP0796-20121207/77567_1 /TAXON_ID=73915 /ORGANISM="Pyrodinium bahamense, Strain pbaha01" /LENGTH=42 /DNA_ID= /DNA_START= /DNA_END= /DNA_ORIENTATION=
MKMSVGSTSFVSNVIDPSSFSVTCTRKTFRPIALAISSSMIW